MSSRSPQRQSRRLLFAAALAAICAAMAIQPAEPRSTDDPAIVAPSGDR